MTPKEREKPDIIDGSRKKRIAAGSGTDIVQVNNLLKQFDQMRSMMKKVNQMQSSGKMKAFK
jgi:signal recognition particle subunit SRP54